MDSNEREVQKSLGLFNIYLVSLWVARRSRFNRSVSYIVEAVNEDDAKAQAIEKAYAEHNGAVRRNQFKVHRITLCERKK